MARLAAKEQEVYEVQTSARDLYRARRYRVCMCASYEQVPTSPHAVFTAELGSIQLAVSHNVCLECSILTNSWCTVQRIPAKATYSSTYSAVPALARD